MMPDEELQHEYRRVDDKTRRSNVKKAWNAVYLKGKGVTSQDVNNILSSESLIPVQVSFSLYIGRN